MLNAFPQPGMQVENHTLLAERQERHDSSNHQQYSDSFIKGR